MRFSDSVLNECGRTVYRTCLAKTADEELSRDILGDVFVLLFDKKPHFADKTALVVWMVRTASRLIANHYRKERNISGIPLEDVNVPSPADPLTFELLELLKSLPEKLRDVTVLYYIEDMSVKDISRCLGLAQGTVKSRLFHARELLTKTYKEEIL